jgi:hypothetical protein
MTVKELVKELEDHDDDRQVVIETELLDEVPVEYVRQNMYGEVVLS